MKTRLVGVAAALAVFSASPASAAVIVTSVGGTPQAAVSGSSYITFEDVSVGTFGNFTSGGSNFTGTGLITNTTTLFPLTHAQPKFDTTHYLAIGSAIILPTPRTETLTLSSDYTKFGFYWGSIDSYNSVTFYNNGSAVYSLSGSAVPGVNLNANAESSNTRNRYVNFDFTGGSAFDQVVFQTTFRTFELDNVALAGQVAIPSAVPELSTWAMMLLGFGGVGLLAYRRSKKTLAATAAI
jgi:hypothetical protein